MDFATRLAGFDFPIAVQYSRFGKFDIEGQLLNPLGNISITACRILCPIDTLPSLRSLFESAEEASAAIQGKVFKTPSSLTEFFECRATSGYKKWTATEHGGILLDAMRVYLKEKDDRVMMCSQGHCEQDKSCARCRWPVNFLNLKTGCFYKITKLGLRQGRRIQRGRSASDVLASRFLSSSSGESSGESDTSGTSAEDAELDLLHQCVAARSRVVDQKRELHLATYDYAESIPRLAVANFGN